ncbi:GNAT family N-acetyltransferase [Paenibacillus sp. YYML68]|uniref:GNAT family N-acetyltransferase n=1 Tax=Paenibacillus sp. YYML68 TaxID=2909250 RepID=UPI0024909E18|nr:GNAT family N-acetyltransferase [Paenibacillus sp. YYML68]
MEIRSYSPLDHDEVWRVHLLVITEAGVEATHSHYHDILNIPKNYLQAGGDFLVGVEESGVVIAIGGLFMLESGQAEIKRLRVHPDYQKRGYGQRLLSELEERARERGIARLKLDTLTSQYGAQGMFLKNGYEPKGSARIDGFDVLLYEKQLA